MRRPLTIAVLAALLGLTNLCAQQAFITDYLAECERKYGSDADLVNGEKYFYPYRQFQGDPFFFSESRNAVILIHDKEFAEQQLRYDIFNQQLILDFQDIYGANSSLVIRSEWVETFAFKKQNFVRMKGPDGNYDFFQLVSEGDISCVYMWSKEQQLNLNSGVQSYYFTEPSKQPYLVIEGKFYPYKSNKAFLKAFDPELQKSIKQFMKGAKVKVNKAPDMQIRHLIEYCNSLYHEAS